MTERLTLAQARRVAVAAQGFAQGRPKVVTAADLRRTIGRTQLHQIDSVNVLARAHYLPAFSRLGAYDIALLDRAAWGHRRERRLFEYWAHEASLLPLELHPLLRWRMAEADQGSIGWASLRAYAGERRPEAMALLKRIREDGPLAASDVEQRTTPGGWWTWSEAKRQLEWLFWAGHVTTATRRGSFERVYDLTERIIPAAVLALPTLSPADAHKALVERSARALGIATEPELRDYFRLKPAQSAAAVAALVADGVLLPTTVPGWSDRAFLHRDARRPRRLEARALLAPFDPLVWERTRTERLFGFRYRLEIYTPADRRVHGYYVLPFLLGDRLVARADLKADRQAGHLLVQQVTVEHGAPGETMRELAAELDAIAMWLGLNRPLPLAEGV
ncbi:MAG: winged helix-turn-helix protein [Sphingomonas bacterium]|uniref:winged helix-turn-helix domain-containing protein n=1 Tax=Sphingomonas bacterium TaxID=1895847 RepID=UPI0026102927|nr:crosslink repair DNA glycosylase YcaQ family protein [Sphingomonas bacterium]MDB5695055.1 winged helix-turn-helix protein [Sphingomonas bacterium]